MKNYALAVIAVSLGLLLNAFTTVKKDNHRATGQALIWYYIDGNNEIDPNDPINPSDPVDETNLESVYSACAGSGVPCPRGFSNTSLPTGPTSSGIMDTEKGSH